MAFLTLRSSRAAVAVSTATAIGVTLSQQRRLPEGASTIVLALAELMGLVAVPVLIALAFRDRLKTTCAHLPTWRKGLGLSSVVLLLLIWLSFTGEEILYILHHNSAGFLTPTGMTVLLRCTWVAAALALPLRGSARLQGLAAALLTWACLEASVRF